MKTLKIKYLIFFVVASLMMQACDDKVVTYNDGYDNGLTSTGQPQISKVSPITSRDETITGGDLAQMIIIQGSNLSGVDSIKFNDVKVDLKEAYIKAKEIVLPIPRVIPGTVTDKLYIYTKLGSTTFDFKVSIPSVSVTGLYNEFCAAGDTAKIIGSNFDLYEIDTIKGAVTLGGTPVKIVEATASMLRVAIPANATPDSKIAISSPKLTTPIELLWRHTGLLMLNFNNLSDNGIWAGQGYITDGTKSGDPIPLTGLGKFAHIVLTSDAWGWNSLFGGGLNISDADVIANPQNYLFKFEINTKTAKPLAVGNIVFRLNGGWLAWNPAVGVSFNTYDQWKTVSFELTSISALPLTNGWNSFEIIYQPTSAMSCDFSYANLRIVHK
jgi:hypothetical protein